MQHRSVTCDVAWYDVMWCYVLISPVIVDNTNIVPPITRKLFMKWRNRLQLCSFPSFLFLLTIATHDIFIEISPLMLSYITIILSWHLLLSPSILSSHLLISILSVLLLFLFFFTLQEGAILAILDTPNRPYQTVWHLIDEKWLIRWRRYVPPILPYLFTAILTYLFYSLNHHKRFAMGRGARRYIPPGKYCTFVTALVAA